jgi:hypothetical protein
VHSVHPVNSYMSQHGSVLYMHAVLRLLGGMTCKPCPPYITAEVCRRCFGQPRAAASLGSFRFIHCVPVGFR